MKRNLQSPGVSNTQRFFVGQQSSRFLDKKDLKDKMLVKEKGKHDTTSSLYLYPLINNI